MDETVRLRLTRVDYLGALREVIPPHRLFHKIELINKYLNICPEFFDVFEVLEFGISKYGGNGDNWLEPNASKMDHLSNCKSRNNHLQEDLEEKGHKDHESSLDVKLHEACRALMQHTREVRGTVHEKDKVSETE